MIKLFNRAVAKLKDVKSFLCDRIILQMAFSWYVYSHINQFIIVFIDYQTNYRYNIVGENILILYNSICNTDLSSYYLKISFLIMNVRYYHII